MATAVLSCQLQTANATTRKKTPVKKSAAAKAAKSRDDAAKDFGEQLLLKMTEPPRKPAPAQATTTTHFLQGLVLHNEVSDQLERIGVYVALRVGKRRALVVQKIKPGSSAFYEGLTDGDEIKNIGQGKGTLTIVFDRNGKVYSVNVACPAGYELSAQEIKDFLSQNPKPLPKQKIAVKQVVKPNQNVEVVTVDSTMSDAKFAPIAQRLAPYDIQLIVGSKPDAKSKELQWCRYQIKDLVAKLQKSGRSVGLAAMAPVSSGFINITNCTPELVDKTFSATSAPKELETRTELLARMENAIAAHASTQHPFLIAVFLDAKSQDNVQETLMDSLKAAAAKQPQTARVTVAAFSLTDSPSGIASDTTADTPTAATVKKAKTFSELKENGLAQSLADAVSEQVRESEPEDEAGDATAGKANETNTSVSEPGINGAPKAIP